MQIGDPAAQRLREEEERPDAYKALEQVLTEYTNLAASQDAAYEHIDAEARGKVKACVDEAAAWFSGIKSTQEAAVRIARGGERAQARESASAPVLSQPSREWRAGAIVGDRAMAADRSAADGWIDRSASPYRRQAIGRSPL